MVQGKKNYLAHSSLAMGLAVLFVLGDAESIARYKNKDRRDFMLLSNSNNKNGGDDITGSIKGNKMTMTLAAAATSSLAGILRTIRKYGYKNLNNTNDNTSAAADSEPAAIAAAKQNASSQQQQKNINNKDDAGGGNKEEDLVFNDNNDDEDEIDDTAELDKLTGIPHPQYVLLQAVPICAPYSTLSQYPIYTGQWQTGQGCETVC